MRRRVLACALALVFLAPSLALAGDKWEKPKDGVMTEKEVDAYTDAAEKIRKLAFEKLDWMQQHPADKATDMKAYFDQIKDFDEREKKIREDSGLARPQFEWVGKETEEIFMLWWIWSTKLKPDLDASLKDANDKVAAAQKTADDIAAAKKSGKRIMTPEDKENAKKSAEEQVKPAEDALKDAKAATADAKKALDEAKQAAKNADADGKADAEQAVKDRQDGLKATQDAEAEAAKNLDIAKRRAKDPDVPATPDEKADNDRDLADREQRAKDELDNAKKGRDLMTGAVKEVDQKLEADLKKHPDKNVEIVKARRDRLKALYIDSWNRGKDKDKEPAAPAK